MPGRNDPCPCGSGKKYKRCCLNAKRPAPREPVDDGRLTLMVDTRDGVLIRRIPPAMTLRLGVEQGPAAEQATNDAASFWGLPDFVYRADLRKLGSGSRELGGIPPSQRLAERINATATDT